MVPPSTGGTSCAELLLVHPLLLFARHLAKPGRDEPTDIDSDARDRLTHAIRDYANEPDLADGIRALGVFAATLAEEGSPKAAREIVWVLERVGPDLEFRFDAGEIAAALDEVCLYTVSLGSTPLC